jgi:hypothetical protein
VTEDPSEVLLQQEYASMYSRTLPTSQFSLETTRAHTELETLKQRLEMLEAQRNDDVNMYENARTVSRTTSEKLDMLVAGLAAGKESGN